MQAQTRLEGPLPGPAQAGSAPCPIDHQHLARYTMGLASLEIEVLGLFASQAQLTFAALERARDAKAWRDAAHTLKGSARAVGAWRVADHAAEAEAMPAGPASPDRSVALANIRLAIEETGRYIASLPPAAD